MGTMQPRAVIVTRPSAYELLVARHGTARQAQFFLESRGQSLEPLVEADRRLSDAVQSVDAAVPLSWRRARVERKDLDRFLFAEDDVVIAVGQDGLVANAAKYLKGQVVVGINPDPEANAGVLVPHPHEACADLLADIAAGRHRLERRTMVEAEVDGGHHLRALNEVFIGHRSHQSARYRVRHRGESERHSSSGVVVSTGTGATGWARSIQRERARKLPDVLPEDRLLLFYVREAFPSPMTGCDLTCGLVEDELEFVSEMNEGGVIFGDGIEEDRIDFRWGRRATVRIAADVLNLVVM